MLLVTVPTLLVHQAVVYLVVPEVFSLTRLFALTRLLDWFPEVHFERLFSSYVSFTSTLVPLLFIEQESISRNSKRENRRLFSSYCHFDSFWSHLRLSRSHHYLPHPALVSGKEKSQAKLAPSHLLSHRVVLFPLLSSTHTPSIRPSLSYIHIFCWRGYLYFDLAKQSLYSLPRSILQTPVSKPYTSKFERKQQKPIPWNLQSKVVLTTSCIPQTLVSIEASVLCRYHAVLVTSKGNHREKWGEK